VEEDRVDEILVDVTLELLNNPVVLVTESDFVAALVEEALVEEALEV